jgi:sterol desaturase/sphingolipid hydroxylase (fatty acid hydroxylase superfamily)
MSTRQFLTNLAIIVIAMAVAALIEVVVPFAARPAAASGRRRANLALTTVVFLLNWTLSSVAAVLALALSFQPPTLMATYLPAPVRIAAGVILLDFSAGYVAHWALHMIPAMWRFHRIHHSDDFVDVTTTYRTHPVETVWRFLFAMVPVWTLGIPTEAVVIHRLLGATNGIFEHSNVRLWAPLDRLLSFVWVTPNVHKIHHSRVPGETNSNYGNVLTLYDRLFGTYTPSDRAASVVYGLDDADPSRIAAFTSLLAMPFRPPVPRSLTEKSGSNLTAADNMLT